MLNKTKEEARARALDVLSRTDGLTTQQAAQRAGVSDNLIRDVARELGLVHVPGEERTKVWRRP